jgi:hypothetical protein
MMTRMKKLPNRPTIARYHENLAVDTVVAKVSDRIDPPSCQDAENDTRLEAG